MGEQNPTTAHENGRRNTLDPVIHTQHATSSANVRTCRRPRGHALVPLCAARTIMAISGA